MTQPHDKNLPSALEPQFIQNLIKQQKLVTFYLVSGIRLQGYIIGYDKYTLLLKSNSENRSHSQLVYKHAISTVLITPLPSRTFNHPTAPHQANATVKKKKSKK